MTRFDPNSNLPIPVDNNRMIQVIFLRLMHQSIETPHLDMQAIAVVLW